MALATLHQAVIEGVSALLPAWRFVKGARSFRRVAHGCNQTLHLSFVNHVDDFDVVGNVAVEHLIKRKRLCVVGAELGNILGTGQQRWPVSSATQASLAANGVVELFQKVGVPYLERYSSLAEVLRVLREEPQNAWLLSPLAKDFAAEANAIEERGKESVA